MKTRPEPCAVCGASDWGTRGRCRPCHAKRARETRSANLAAFRARENANKKAWRAANPAAALEADRRKLYGVSTAMIEGLVSTQGGVCAICRRAEPDCVDHCHATGRIRGMLCKACNAGLGLLRDDPALMRAAAEYLVKRGS